MKSITRHAIDPELAAEGVEREGSVIDSLLETARTRSQALSMLLGTARSQAGYLSVRPKALGPLCASLRTGASAAGALFALASGSGEVEVELDQKKVRLPATGANDATHPGNWRVGWWLAHVVGDKGAIERLMSVTVELLRRSSSRGDECQYLFVDALQSFEKHADDWSTKLQSAVDATDAEQITLSDEEFVLEILVPEMELFFRFATGDQPAFNETLQFALERHKKYWSKGKRKQDPDGFIALGPLAISTLARRAGFAIEVESDYLPKAVLEGRCSS